ncbi:invasion associated locus B family protein [Bradyrhizobium sp. WYCCWR 13023]|uniref:Invasion associated locus B family protein n=1 Tax=Bradyrhizobium zhengyangense TaxID=2911009 RepID=A0A9X1R7R1_9BRAD|nr:MULTISPECIES: invasion associated locus B family protein [Bradyrhizobium]MCG2626547.1 invasion associated locus B family protein [Bradyrhizobium zhengyangense]MCG2665680.1 invasion associated locus B family protein [Bradyrhizobium zhengyangense]MDA9524069.1 invasion protein B [Bradyrhizobium sp. CCBAU 11434]
MPRPLRFLSGFLVLAVASSATSPGLAARKATAQVDKSAEVATRGQREAKDVTYGDWQKVCFTAGGAPKLCRTSITGIFPTGQTAVRVDLIEREDSPTVRLQLFMPVGMYLQQPAKVRIDHGSARRVPYNWCATNTCIAADVADPAMIKEMESGKTLTLEVVDANLLALTTSIPLAQFATVHKGAPAKTLEQYVDE